MRRLGVPNKPSKYILFSEQNEIKINHPFFSFTDNKVVQKISNGAYKVKIWYLLNRSPKFYFVKLVLQYCGLTESFFFQNHYPNPVCGFYP